MNILPQVNPLLLAKQAASLDLVSNGRFMLGVGIGWLREEFHAMGAPFERRGARFDDYIAAMRKVWSGEMVEHRSEFLDWSGFKSYPLPLQNPLPVIIEVVFGSWCPACKQTVPRFMKSMSAAGNPNLGVSYTGVPTPPFSEYPAVKEKDIRGVPTFIVYAGQAEIGRISSIPGNSSVEHELVAILTAHRQSKR